MKPLAFSALSTPANRVIMAAVPEWFVAGTLGGGGAPPHTSQYSNFVGNQGA